MTLARLRSLLRLFAGRAREPDTTAAAPAASPAQAGPPTGPISEPTSEAIAGPTAGPAAGPTAGPAGALDDDVNRRFTALLLGAGPLRRADPSASERLVLDRLEQLACSGHDSNLVPRLPAVLPRLIGLVRRDEVSSRELAEHLSRDPALVGEVVRLANSPRYRTGREVADLQEAVIVLGQRGLIQLVTSAAMRPIFNVQQGRFSRVAGTRLWDLSERCAHACAFLYDGADRFQAYLAGMVSSAGLIVALRVLDLGYRETQPPDSEGFHRALEDVTTRLSEGIARHWNFHPNVCRAVGARGRSQPGPADDDLIRALRTADRVSRWHVLMQGVASVAPADLSPAEQRCHAELERTFCR
jgi:HD-like signal output (HDOD) protein